MTPVGLSRQVPPSPAASRSQKALRVKQVDAFTTVPLTGNPAGVVLDGTGLSEEHMQVIARELSVSETAFILPASTPAAHLAIRWFTPQTEVPLCGHATIAAFHALAEEGLWGMQGPGSYKFNVETPSGVLPVTVDKSRTTIEVFFGLVVPKFVRAGHYKLDLMRILNVSLDEFENRLPIVATDYLYVPFRRLHSIYSLKPNFFAMSQFLSNKGLRGLCAFTTETIDPTSVAHSRFFAPTVGINEDPVTGTANGPLGVYLLEHGRVERQGESILMTAEQGDPIGRKGRVKIRLTLRGSEVAAVQIGGCSVTILSSEMVIG